MSLDYVANNKNAPEPEHNENSCGCDLLGYIHFAAGASVSPLSKLRVETYGRPPRVPYKSTAEQCKKDAALLRATPDDVFVALLEKPAVKDCFGGTAQDFLDFVKEWSEFLENCEGYEVPQ